MAAAPVDPARPWRMAGLLHCSLLPPRSSITGLPGCMSRSVAVSAAAALPPGANACTSHERWAKLDAAMMAACMGSRMMVGDDAGMICKRK